LSEGTSRKNSPEKSDRLNLVDFLDDDPQKRESDLSILNGLDHVRQVMQEKNIDISFSPFTVVRTSG
jgi:hypothetical protein